MQIQLNGEKREIQGAQTVAQLLAHFEIDVKGVVVEHNQKVVKPEQFGNVTIDAEDVVEIVRFVGGG